MYLCEICASVYAFSPVCGHAYVCTFVHMKARGWFPVSSSVTIHCIYCSSVSHLNLEHLVCLATLSPSLECWHYKVAMTPAQPAFTWVLGDGALAHNLPTEPSPQMGCDLNEFLCVASAYPWRWERVGLASLTKEREDTWQLLYSHYKQRNKAQCTPNSKRWSKNLLPRE